LRSCFEFLNEKKDTINTDLIWILK